MWRKQTRNCYNRPKWKRILNLLEIQIQGYGTWDFFSRGTCKEENFEILLVSEYDDKIENKYFLTFPLYTCKKCNPTARRASVLSEDTKLETVKTYIICFSNSISTLLPREYANVGLRILWVEYDIRCDFIFICHMSDAIEEIHEALIFCHSAAFRKKKGLGFSNRLSW
jgi:hypothetical protein